MATSCPTPPQLLAYHVGTLPEESAGEVTDHVSTCPTCQTELATLDAAEDSMVGRLRQPLPQDEYASEPECQEAVARAEAALGGRLAIPGGEGVGGASETTALGQLGEYRLLAKLGQGGMGAVYKALHVHLGRPAALKVLRKGRGEDDKAIARFYREMRAIGQLSHPNIVQAYDAREIDGSPVLVMEYVEGVDLAELVRRRGPLPVPDACELVRQAARGLQYVHEQDLVHRDIKPSNLMLAATGCCVKILDLGLARFRLDEPADAEMTADGQAVGTADYMAPEQACDCHTVDIRADIYSLGCTLYKLLTGNAPFALECKRLSEKMLAQVSKLPRPIRESRPEVPEPLAALVDRILAKAPSDRFSTPAEVADALLPFCSGCALECLLEAVGHAPQSPARPEHRLASTADVLGAAASNTGPKGTAGRRYELSGRFNIGKLGCGMTLAVSAACLLLAIGGLWMVQLFGTRALQEVELAQMPEVAARSERPKVAVPPLSKAAGSRDAAVFATPSPLPSPSLPPAPGKPSAPYPPVAEIRGQEMNPKLARSAVKQTNKDSQLIEKALLSEVEGSNDQRKKILQSVLEETPDHRSARWHSGYVWFSNQWLDYRQFPKELRQDKRITDYWDLRDRCKDEPEHQLKLGQWCYQRKLVDQARAHWSRVLELDPENADARKLLGHQNLGEEWLTEEQLQEAKQTEEGHKKATAKWGRELASIGKNLQSKSQKQREYAKQRLLETDDPGIVGPLVSMLAGQTEELDQVVVEVLGRIKTPESSVALARLAVMSPWRPVRTAAARQLRPRKIDDYAPPLLAAASTEMVSQFQVQPAPAQRSVYYRHLFFREGRDRKEVAALNRTYQIDPQSVAPNLDMRDCLLGAAASAKQAELWREQQNVAIRETNERIAEAIYEASGDRLSASPTQWWKWWDQIKEVYVAGDKKVVAYSKNEHMQVSSDLASPGIAAAGSPSDKDSERPPGKSLSPGSDLVARRPDRAETGRRAQGGSQTAAFLRGVPQLAQKASQQFPSPQMPWHSRGWSRSIGRQDLPPIAWGKGPELSTEKGVPTWASPTLSREVAEVSRERPEMSREEAAAQRFDCLAPGTQVWTESGLCAIKEIQVGDLVLSQDVETGQLQYKPVLSVRVRPKGTLLQIKVGDKAIESSGGHPLWVSGQGWVKARDLKPGMRLHCVTGIAEVQEVLDNSSEQQTHNLVVADFHTFFVGKAKILTHDNTTRKPTQCVVPGLAKR